MSQPVPFQDPDGVVHAVAAALGGLSVDEHVAIYGAAVARRATHPDGAVSAAGLQTVSQVLIALRYGPCRWCGAGLDGHFLELSAGGTDVRCLRDDRSRPAPVWLAGPVPVSTGYRIASILAWVGLPLLSIGILAWAMPMIAGVLRRRPSWIIAAVILIALVVVGSMLPDDDLGGLLLVSAWLGGTVYGVLQVKPWLKTRPPPERAHQPYPGG